MVFFCPRLSAAPLEILTCGRALERTRIRLDSAEWPALPRKVNMWELRLAARLARVRLPPTSYRKWDAAVVVQRAVRRWRLQRRAPNSHAPKRAPITRPIVPLKLPIAAALKLPIVPRPAMLAGDAPGRLHELSAHEQNEIVHIRPIRVADGDAMRTYYRAREMAALAQLERLQEQAHRRELVASGRNSSWFRRQQRSTVRRRYSTACWVRDMSCNEGVGGVG